MKKEGLLIAAIFSFLVLFSSAVYAENCCLRPQSNFCTDVSAQSCCGTDANCLNTQYFQGASCSDFCFGGKGCCLDSCTDAWIAGTSTPIACSSPQVYSQKPCAEYSECTSGCAFCSNYTASIGNFPLFIASQKCSNLSRRLSLFNTSTTACMNISQASSTLFSVSGKVTDAGGAPVPGVSIKIAGSAATTTSSGNYRITNLPVGNFTVRAWHINYNESLTPLFIDSNKTFDIVLQKIQTATLTVNVFNSDNSPADGAAVTADSASLTAAGGIAVFSDLPILQPNGLRRYYRITASLGGAQNSATINLSSGANTVSITLPSAVVGTGSLSGYIINSSGFPVNGATVSIAGREYFTLANGLYQFSDLPATSYEITAMPPQPYLQKTDSISIAAGEVLAHNITVNALSAENVAILTVEVVNWTDTFEKIEGATVTIRLAGAITPEAVLTTGADGKAVVTLPVAEYFVTAEKAGYQMTVPPQYVDLSGDKTEQVWLKKLIFVGFSLSGTVTDVETMKPIDRASVSVRGAAGNYYAVTGEDGSYVINDIPSSLLPPNSLVPYALVTSKLDYAGDTQSISIIANTQKNIMLRKAACFSNVAPPEITLLEMIKNETHLKFSSPCQIKGYYVYRCEGASCTGTKPITNMIGPSQTEFFDTKVEPNKWYTYEIHAYFESPLVQEKISGQKSIYTGAKECFNPDTSEFCYNNTRSVCDANNTILTVYGGEAGPDDFCMQDGLNTEYVSKINCSVECNTPMGMFSIFGLFSSTNCSQPSLLSSLAYCYKDYTKTVVSRFYSCEGTKTCYDYLSKDACNKNSCGLDQAGDCAWRSYSQDLSLGVCMPKNEKYWNCSRCNQADKFNNLFGQCNSEICDLYGGNVGSSGNAESHYCFFSGGLCAAKNQRSCDDYYTNQSQCLGDDGNVSVRIESDNEITKRSKDWLDFGLCRFGSSNDTPYTARCFKDANNNYLHDPNANDMQVPYTSVIHPTAANRIDFNFTVYDNENNMTAVLSTAQTYSKVTRGGFGRPTVLAQNGRITEPSVLDNVTYKVWFYSKDNADNLEVVKSFAIFIDRSPPTINFGQAFLNSTRTLTVYLNSTENVTCNAKLYDDNYNLIPPQLVDGLGTEFASSYPDTADGVYFYEYSCLDWVGNNVSDSKIITIDTDGMIYNGQPNSTIKDGPALTISVNTRADGNCKYLDVPTVNGSFVYKNLADAVAAGETFDTMTPFTTTGAKYHEAGVTVNDDSIAKLYLVRCLLNETNEFTKSNISAIRFTVDRLYPTTKFYEAYQVTAPIDYNFSIWRNQAGLKIACFDPPSPPLRPSSYSPKEFGCNYVSYCVDYGACEPVVATLNANISGTGNSTNATNATEAGFLLNETQMVCFSSADKGNNTEPVGCTLVRIDTTSPRVKIKSASGFCTVDENGVPECRTNVPELIVNGTVDNVAYWSDKGGLMPYFANFTFNATVSSADVSEVVFDWLAQDSYDYVQLNFKQNQLAYGSPNNPHAISLALTPNEPVNLTITASGLNAEIFINGVSQVVFERSNPEGWIRSDNITVSNVVIDSENASSPLYEEFLTVVINEINQTQKIPIVNGRFDDVLDISSLLSNPTGFIELRVADSAGNAGEDSMIVIFDTIGPLIPPLFDPPINDSLNYFRENYDNLGYPIHYDPQSVPPTYYVGAGGGKIYLTGYTSEPGERIEFWVNDTQNPVNYTEPPNETYSRIGVNLTANEKSDAGSSQVTIRGSALTSLGDEKYIVFDGHHRTGYGHYGEAYEITSINSTHLGTVIKLNTPLEQEVKQNEGMIISNMLRPTDRFNISFDMNPPNPYGQETWQLLQFDDLNNPGAASEQMEVVYDSIPPKIVSASPSFFSGRIYDIGNITVDVLENGSGLRYDNINLTINGQRIALTNINVTTLVSYFMDDAHGLIAKYRIYYDCSAYSDGDYLIKLILSDKANNRITQTWNLTMDKAYPMDPVFTVTNGVLIDIDDLNPGQIWHFVNGTPEVKADYVPSISPYSPPVIVLRSVGLVPPSSAITWSANCTRIEANRDRFNCTMNISSFDDGDYQLSILPAKTFADGTFREKDRYDIFSFVRDTQKPVVSRFNLTNKYINFLRSNVSINFTATVANERHNLKVRLSLTDNNAKVFSLDTDSAKYSDMDLFGKVTEATLNKAKADGLSLVDGHAYPVRINVSDYAGNYNDAVAEILTIDNTPPFIDPQNITVNAIPIYQYVVPGTFGENESTTYIVRKDILNISGIVPADVAGLFFYRVKGDGTSELLDSIKSCTTSSVLGCVSPQTGRFVLPAKNTTVVGTLGEVMANRIRIVAVDRAGNTDEITKLVYTDLEKPGIIICVSPTECTSYQENVPPVTNLNDVKASCSADPSKVVTCYWNLISQMCLDENNNPKYLCREKALADIASLGDTNVAKLCADDFVPNYVTNCIRDVAVNSCSKDICGKLSNLQNVADCESDVNARLNNPNHVCPY